MDETYYPICDIAKALEKIERHLDFLAHAYGVVTGQPYTSPDDINRLYDPPVQKELPVSEGVFAPDDLPF